MMYIYIKLIRSQGNIFRNTVQNNIKLEENYYVKDLFYTKFQFKFVYIIQFQFEVLYKYYTIYRYEYNAVKRYFVWKHLANVSLLFESQNICDNMITSNKYWFYELMN